MRIYVHGNCQAPAIAHLIRQQFVGWDIASYEVFSAKILNEINRYHYYVETADIIICQPVQDGYRDRVDLSSNWVRASAKPSVQLIAVPAMFFDGQLVGCRTTKVPSYGMPYHDALFVHLVTAGVELPEIVKILLAEDLYSAKFIENEIALSLDEMRRRERAAGIEVTISPFLADYGTVTQIFHVINHPCRPALAYITNQVLARLGYPVGVPSSGDECLRFPHIPCLPSVVRFLRAGGTGPKGWEIEDGELYHLPAEKLTRSEYFARAREHLAQFPKGDLLASLGNQDIRSFLQRVAIATPSLPGIQVWDNG